MPIGTCDPATRGDSYNELTLSIDDGAVTLTIRYGWDGRSTREMRTHVVAEGETLLNIANLYGATRAELREWNGMPSNAVTVGQELIVWPGDCDGPLVEGAGGGNLWAVRAVNNSDVPYYAHTVGKRGQPRVLTLQAGATATIRATVAANNGYQTLSDIHNLTLTTSPTP